MAILGIDYGAKKIGLAKSDSEQKFALPLEIIINNNLTDTLNRIKEICQQQEIEAIVVGVPLSLKAEKRDAFFRLVDLQNQQMKEVLGFVDFLKTNLDLPIEIEDERLSTKMAIHLRRDLVKKGPDDAVAAMLILQTYLDKLNR